MAIVTHFHNDADLSYAGRSLGYWCDQLPSTVLMPGAGTGLSWGAGGINDEAEVAISALGTNCLPLLLSRLQSEYSPYQLGLRKVLAKFRVISPSEVNKVQNRREQALTGIALLGRKADAILPAIANLKRGDPWLSSAASYLTTRIRAANQAGDTFETER